MEVGDMLVGRVADDEYEKMSRQLNVKQLEFVLHAAKWIRTKIEPMRAFLSGGAGCGKSVVVCTLYQYLHRCLYSVPGENPEDCRILLAAPTGCAAYNIGGATIHSSLKINPHQNCDNQDVLKNQALATMRQKYKHLKLVVFDEVSMISNRLLVLINKRLQQIKDNTQFMGNLHVLFVGDLFQLKPVMGGWIFSDYHKLYDEKNAFKSQKSKKQPTDYKSLVETLWKSNNFRLFELVQIMRQKDDLAYAEIMNRLREGNHTEQDLKTLKSRQMEQTDRKHKDYPLHLPHLYYLNMNVDAHNTIVYKNENASNIRPSIEAHDTVLGDYTSKTKAATLERLSHVTDPSKTANLVKTLDIAIGMQYDVSVNVFTEDGIFNGASCVLKHVQYRPESSIPKILWVQFLKERTGKMTRDKYSHYYTTGIQRQWTPLFYVERTFNYLQDSKTIQRCQFPNRPSAGKTIHKSQGSSLPEVVLDMSHSRKSAHVHYVALSRVENMSGLHIRNLCEHDICVDQNVVKEMKRLREHCQLDLCYIPFYRFPDNMFKISFLNARSLHKHAEDIRADHSFDTCDIMSFSETRLYDGERCDMHGYNMYLNSEPTGSNKQRPYHGLAVYVKDTIQVSDVTCVRFSHAEYMVLKIVYCGTVLQMVCLYRSSKCSIQQFMEQIRGLSKYIEGQDQTFVIGDFNCDLNTNVGVRNAVESLSAGLNHLKTENTFQNSTGALTCIDHAFTTVVNHVATVIECMYSDHKIIGVALEM